MILYYYPDQFLLYRCYVEYLKLIKFKTNVFREYSKQYGGGYFQKVF